MDADRELTHQEWYLRHWTPEEIWQARTRWNNVYNNRAPWGIAVTEQYERYYEERRAREAAILPDGVAQ